MKNRTATSDEFTGLSPTEFEKYCLDVLKAMAENDDLPNFSIIHDKKIKAYDSTYQIDVYAEFTAMGCLFRVLCECKKHTNPIERDIVVALNSKLGSVGAQKGIIMSTSSFQSGAIQFANSHGIALIQLCGKDCLFHSYASEKEDNTNDENEFIRKYYPPLVAEQIVSSDDYDELRAYHESMGANKDLVSYLLSEAEKNGYSKRILIYPSPKMIQGYRENRS